MISVGWNVISFVRFYLVTRNQWSLSIFLVIIINGRCRMSTVVLMILCTVLRNKV